MKKLTKIFAFISSVIMALVVFTGCGATETKLTLATGGAAGTYYAYGQSLANIVTENTNVKVSAVTSGASAANILQISNMQADIAIVQNDVAYYAYTGTDLFADKGEQKDIRIVGYMYSEVCQIVARDGINSIEDLRGKRVSVGDAGSGVEFNAKQILEAYGITYEDIDEQYLSFSEAANGLKDGNIDAAFLTAGYPTAAIQDIAAQNAVRMLPVDAAKADALVAKYPFYAKSVIPAGTYPGQNADVPGVAVKAMLVVTDKMSADDCYAITKALYSNLDRIKASHNVGGLITKDGAREGMSLTLNPGAEKFFNE